MATEVTDMAKLGRIIRYHRRRAGLSRAALSDLAGTGTTVIYEIEHGKSTARFDVLKRIVDTLNLKFMVDGPLLDEYSEKTDAKS